MVISAGIVGMLGISDQARREMVLVGLSVIKS